MKFNYQARTKTGEIQAGTVEAPSKEAALTLLHKYGLYVTLLEEIVPLPVYARKIKIFERITRADLVLFSRQLSIMFRSKVPLIEALGTLASQTKKTEFREKILKISEEVEGGTALSTALSHHPKIFSPLYISMVRSGEASGKLSEALSYLADHLEREYDLVSKTRGAMIYPAFILVFFLIVITVMLIWVVPQLTKVLEETGQTLPLITQIVIGISKFVRSRGWILIILFLTLAGFIHWYLKTPEGGKFFDRVSLKFPLIGDFLKKTYLSRLAENLSTLISGGLPIARALEITGEVVGNDVYRTIILETRDEVRRGEPISSVLARYPEAFPPVFGQMTLVGERTGTLDTSLMNIVVFYHKEVDRAIDNLLSLLEPILIVFLGLLVALFAISIILPLYQIGVGG